MPRLPKGILGLPTRPSFAVLTKASCRWNGVQKSRKWFRHAPNIKTVAGNYATKGRLISVTPSHLSIMVEHGWTVIGFPVLVLFLLEIVWNMILVTSTAVESMPVNSEVATATGEHNIYIHARTPNGFKRHFIQSVNSPLYWTQTSSFRLVLGLFKLFLNIYIYACVYSG